MKPKQLLLSLVAITALFFTSCKKSDIKDTTTETEIETTFNLSGDQAIADFLTDDANDIMMSVAEEQNLTGSRGGDPVPSGFLCATVTVTPLSGFPKTILIDFGPLPGCLSNGITRSGQIQIVVSDSLRRPQSTSVMTFHDYFVNGYKKEGTITWKNTSVPPVRSWRRSVEHGKVTAPDGTWWLHNDVKEFVQIAGQNTFNPIDDEFRITGNGNTTNSAGRMRSHIITEPLHKKNACRWIDSGRIRFEGPNHFAVLDYGNGECNRFATISIDGQTTHNILLP